MGDPDVDFLLPISPTRWIAARQQMIQLRDTTTTRWAVAPVVDGSVRDGAIVFDGRAVALLLAQRAGRATIVVLGLRDGSVQHRINVRGATHVRFAARRGAAFVVLGESRLVMIDLRFGRIAADHTFDEQIGDLSVDAAGQLITMHLDDELVELETEELLRAPRGSSPELAVEADEPEPEPEPAIASPGSAGARRTPGESAESIDTVVVNVPSRAEPVMLRGCPALPPCRTVDAPGADAMRELLAAQRRVVIALAAHAIVRAWDEGRAAPDRAPAARTYLDGVAGLTGGLAMDDVLDTAVRLDNALAAHAQLVTSLAPREAPFATLARELGLDELAQQIVLVAAAPALWGELAMLYGLVCNDSARPLCDELLVSTILGTCATTEQIEAALDADAPLVRHGLVRVGNGLQRPFLALSVDPVVVRLLRGSSLAIVGHGITLRPATASFDALDVAPAVAARIVDDLAATTEDEPLRIVVRGRSGSGRHTMLATIAAASGYQLATIDAPALLAGSAPDVELLGVALRRARLANLVPCIDGLERSVLQEPDLRAGIRGVIARHAGPVCVRVPPDAVPPIEPGYVAIELPAQTVAERAVTWDATLAAVGMTVPDTAELAARFGVGPAVIHRVVDRLARERASGTPAERIERAVRQHLDGELGAIATRVERLPTWSQVVLPPDIQDSVTELIGRIRHRRTVFDRWGFDRVMSTSRGTTALFQGGPGTGKTLVAGAIASELGLDLYRVDVSRIMSKWIGETEQNLARLFDAAEDGNAILLFDEADSLFARRTEVKSSNDRFANLEVNYLLQRLDSFEGIAIMTTNFGTSIDSAFKRRLSFRLTFPFPDEEQRERLWRAHLPPQLPVRGTLDLPTVARRYQLSGGYIRNCALRAAFLAAEQGGYLTADHLDRAIKAEFREIGKLAESGVLE